VELLLTAPIPVMAETGVIASAGVLQEQGVIEDSAAQEVWVAVGGLLVQMGQAMGLLEQLVQRSADEAAAHEQGYPGHSVAAV
jgi:hypothetical protein